jgi:hypothetical protein
MSGVRSYSFREGDRAEYLTQFLLSALGLCSAIPRQEDIGYDFACSIANQETGLITFGFPFLITIKSRSQPVIKIKRTKTGIAANDESNVEWLFPDQATLLGIVDKRKLSIDIYSMLPVWFLHWAGPSDVGTMDLKPRLKASELGDVGPPTKCGELPNWPGHYPRKRAISPLKISSRLSPVLQNNFRMQEDAKRLKSCLELMKIAPSNSFPEALLQEFPELRPGYDSPAAEQMTRA